MITTTINYNIKIEGDGRGVSSPIDPTTEGKPSAENPLQPATGNDPVAKKAAKNETLINLALVSAIAKKALSNIGELTGNQEAQKAVNLGFSTVSYVMAFVANPVLAGTTLAIDLTAKTVSAYRDLRTDQRQTAELRRRAGFERRRG